MRCGSMHELVHGACERVPTVWSSRLDLAACKPQSMVATCMAACKRRYMGPEMLKRLLYGPGEGREGQMGTYDAIKHDMWAGQLGGPSWCMQGTPVNVKW